MTVTTGDVEISLGIVFSEVSDLYGASPQFTLACISTGGPATTVTWTRDSTTVTQGTQTVFNDPVTAQYTHTLTVNETLEGVYSCSISNNKPSSDSAELIVSCKPNGMKRYYINPLLCICAVPPPPSNVQVSQNGLNSVLVTWTPSEIYETGYTIVYQRQGEQTMLAKGVRNITRTTISGLMTGSTYSISILANTTISSSAQDITIGIA